MTLKAVCDGAAEVHGEYYSRGMHAAWNLCQEGPWGKWLIGSSPALPCSPCFTGSPFSQNKRIMKHKMQQASWCWPSVCVCVHMQASEQQLCVSLWRATDNSWEKDGETTQYWQHWVSEKMCQREKTVWSEGGERKWNDDWGPLPCDVTDWPSDPYLRTFFSHDWLHFGPLNQHYKYLRCIFACVNGFFGFSLSVKTLKPNW